MFYFSDLSTSKWYCHESSQCIPVTMNFTKKRHETCTNNKLLQNLNYIRTRLWSGRQKYNIRPTTINKTNYLKMIIHRLIRSPSEEKTLGFVFIRKRNVTGIPAISGKFPTKRVRKRGAGEHTYTVEVAGSCWKNDVRGISSNAGAAAGMLPRHQRAHKVAICYVITHVWYTQRVCARARGDAFL